MRHLLLLILLAHALFGQASQPSILFVTSSPAGSCGNGGPMRFNYTTGVLYACDSGTWAVLATAGGGSGPGGSDGQVQYNNMGAFGGLTVGEGLESAGGDLQADRSVIPFKGNCDGASTPVTPTAGYLKGDFCVNTTPDPDTFNVVISDNGTAATGWIALSAGGAVSSVFGRTGDVVAAADDYTASEVTNVPAGGIAATEVQAAIDELDSEKAPIGATYITQTASAGLSAEQALGALATGCLGSTTTTGVVAARSITATTGRTTVTNGDCSGNPTIGIDNDLGDFEDVTLSQADITGLNATAKTLITAKGANTVIWPRGYVLFNDYNDSVAYAGTPNITLLYNAIGGTTINSSSTAGTSFVQATADAVHLTNVTSAGTIINPTGVMNNAVVLGASGAITCASTCGSWKIRIWYSVADFN